MNIEKLTSKSQEVLQKAQVIAEANGQQAIETGHLLKGILEVDNNVLPFLFRELNINDKVVSKTIDSIVASYPKVSGGQLHLSANAIKAIGDAFKLMEGFKDEYLSIEILFLAMVDINDSVGKFLKDSGITKDKLKAAIMTLRNGNSVDSKSSEDTYQALGKYAKDLNSLAKEGKLDPVIGRDEEIRRVLQILTRRTKNNPILIGEPGVGKTAIAEGIAHRIVNGDVPENLKNRKVFSKPSRKPMVQPHAPLAARGWG